MASNQSPNRKLVVIALYEAGGATYKVHTEDIAITAHKMFPDSFSWTKYPDRVDKDIVRVALVEAARPANGVMVEGRSGRGRGHTKGKSRRATDGWKLTDTGLRWVKEHAAEITATAADAGLKEHRQQNQRSLKRVREHPLYKSYLEYGINSELPLGTWLICFDVESMLSSTSCWLVWIRFARWRSMLMTRRWSRSWMRSAVVSPVRRKTPVPAALKKRPIETAKRRLRQDMRRAVRDVSDALVELVTNSDDRYQLLTKQGVTHSGRIEIEIERCRGDSPTMIRARDFADGMTLEAMDVKLGRTGDMVSGLEVGAEVRGTNSRGAKDIQALGTVHFESIARGRWTAPQL